MTPTLLGRWQTRVAMLTVLGLPITLVVAIFAVNARVFLVWFFVLLFGIWWDVVYIGLQRLRWDRDWPAVFQVGAGIFEGLFIFLLVAGIGLPGLPRGSLPLGLFTVHYGLVWLVTFVWVQGPMRAFFPRWRFDGGELN